MEQKELLHRVDHTLLAQTATWSEIQQICDDGIRYGCASVCIPPSYVKQAAEYLVRAGSVCPVCTVIGFPNGYNAHRRQVLRGRDRRRPTAQTEIDMVINLGWVKDRQVGRAAGRRSRQSRPPVTASMLKGHHRDLPAD